VTARNNLQVLIIIHCHLVREGGSSLPVLQQKCSA